MRHTMKLAKRLILIANNQYVGIRTRKVYNRANFLIEDDARKVQALRERAITSVRGLKKKPTI